MVSTNHAWSNWPQAAYVYTFGCLSKLTTHLPVILLSFLDLSVTLDSLSNGMSSLHCEQVSLILLASQEQRQRAIQITPKLALFVC